MCEFLVSPAGRIIFCKKKKKFLHSIIKKSDHELFYRESRSSHNKGIFSMGLDIFQSFTGPRPSRFINAYHEMRRRILKQGL